MRSAAAASTSRASSSAAATSAASARRRPSSAQGETEAEAHALLDAAWEAGITTYDTADAYGGGRSESYLGSWLRGQGAGRARTDRADDEDLQPDERGRRLGSRRRRGSGASSRRASSGSASTRSTSTSRTPWTTRPRSRRRSAPSRSSSPRARSAPTAAATSTRPGSRRRSATASPPGCRTRTRCSSGTTRAASSRSCAREGLGYTPFSPLAGGWLTGKYRRGEEPPAGSRMTLRPEPYRHLAGRTRLRRARGLRGDRATSAGRRPAALAIAWLLGHPHVTAVVIGPRRPDQLRPALEALALDLSPPEHDELGALFA